MRSSSPRRIILWLPLLALVVAAGLLLMRGEPASAACSNNRISWQGGCYYVHGADIPWYNWGCDFGCNSQTGKSGGVSTNAATIAAGLQQMHGAGMHVARWWVFPGTPWQISTDSSGNPTGINPAVYPDFDAALQLAQQYDIYYDFVIFCGAGSSCLPSTWETSSTQQAALAQALGTLFAHYKGNPRILSWEVFNEPDLDVWNGKASQQATVSTAAAITASVHTNSPGTYAIVGTGYADGMSMFNGIGLDYYSPHWYDYMSSGNYCMICHNYAYYASAAENKPIVIGEFPTETATTTPYSSAYRLNYWYTDGFAGAWAWSLFPGRTSDGLTIDFTAAQNFAAQHTDIGPRAGTSSPSPTPRPTPTPVPASFTTSGSATPTSVAQGNSETLKAQVKSATAMTVLVDLEVYDPSNTKVYQKSWTNQTFAAGQTLSYSTIWSVPSTATLGSYTLKLGVFSTNWATSYAWNNGAATFSVAAPHPATYTASATASPTSIAPGSSEKIKAAVTASAGTTVLVDVEVYNASGQKIYQQSWNNQSLTSGMARNYSTNWSVPAGTAAGTYTVEIGIFTPNWGAMLGWNTRAATFNVT